MSAASQPAREEGFGFRFVLPLALGSTLNPVNSTMVATALVPIATDLHVSAAEAGWLVAGLYLASAVAQPTMGRLADLFGARRIYLISLMLVALSGVLGRLAPSLDMLVLVRVLLGIGTSGAYPSAMRLFRERADRLGRKPPRVAMSFLSMAALSTAAIGPLLGGVLTEAFGWHAIFIVNVPLALGTAALVLLWVPKDLPRPPHQGSRLAEIDIPGVTLFTFFLLSLMIFLMNLAQPIWWALAGTILFGVLFALHSMRRRAPFIDVRMLAGNRALAFTYLRAGVLMTICYCVVYGFAQWLESSGGFSSSEAGLMMLPMSVVGACSSLMGGRTKGIRAPILISVGAALIGCLCLLLLDSATPTLLIAAAAMLFGLPQGMFSTANQAAIYIQAPAKDIGMAAGLQRTAVYIGAIAATSILGLLYGHHATDAGFHGVAIVMAVLSAALFAATLLDRTIPRGRV